MILIVILLSSVLTLAISQYLDVLYTSRGIRAGVGVEGNALVTYFIGHKPSAWALHIHNTALSILLFIPAFIGIGHGWPFTFIYIGAAFGYAARHFQGALKWRALLRK
jgi:hypothetical protein